MNSSARFGPIVILARRVLPACSLLIAAAPAPYPVAAIAVAAPVADKAASADWTF